MLTIFGLILDICGVLLIYFNEIPREPDGIMLETFNEEDHRQKVKKARKRSRVGLLLLLFGFLLQLLEKLLTTLPFTS